MLDAAAGEDLLERVRPTHLLHLAWIAQPGVFWTSPQNADWLAAGVRLVRKFYALNGERAVGCGSCAEYGRSDVPCQEDLTPIAPATLYGQCKAALHAALRDAAGARGWAWARIFFPYGPGEAPGRFIPSVIEGLLRREQVACTHGRQIRDFIHADEVAQACVTLVDGQANGAYNVGTGIGHSLREAAHAIIAHLGHGELVRFGEREAPAHDDPYVVADASKMRREHGWSAAISLAEGIRRTLAGLNATTNANVNGAS
jgi:nucleoside-diphosphate-sugar epimerase